VKKNRYQINITRSGETKSYSVGFQTEEKFVRSWQSVLKQHHGHDPLVQCCCPGTGDRRFAIRLRKESGRYHLSRFSNSGIEHFPECVWYSSASISGQQSYTEGVVEEEIDGTLRVQLAVSLDGGNPVDRQPRGDDPPGNQTGGKTQSVMKLLGLLSLLWTEAGLNVWYPAMKNKRFTGSVHGWLEQAAGRVHAGRTRLSDALLIGAQIATPQAEANSDKLASAASAKKRLVVITSLAGWNEERDVANTYIPVRDFAGLPKLEIDAGTWQETLRRHPSEHAAWKRGERIILIVLTDVPVGREAKVLRMALMYVSSRWIPLDSSLEGIIEEKLAAEERSFMKPLRYDSEEDDVFADFHLLDTETNHLPMEVFGMGTPEYVIRKNQKMAIYNSRYGTAGWWHWDAYNSPDTAMIPVFPPAKIRKHKALQK
jgi:hypothetical protein